MKVLKNARQRNFILNKDYYVSNQIKEMLENKEICFFDNFTQSCDYKKLTDIYNPIYRIFSEDLKEIKVIYNKDFGNYETVAIGNNGKLYHIEL